MLRGEGTAPERILSLRLQASRRATPSLDRWLTAAFGNGASGPQILYFPSSFFTPHRREPLENRVHLGVGDSRRTCLRRAASKVFCITGAG